MPPVSARSIMFVPPEESRAALIVKLKTRSPTRRTTQLRFDGLVVKERLSVEGPNYESDYDPRVLARQHIRKRRSHIRIILNATRRSQGT